MVLQFSLNVILQFIYLLLAHCFFIIVNVERLMIGLLDWALEVTLMIIMVVIVHVLIGANFVKLSRLNYIGFVCSLLQLNGFRLF